MPPNDDAWSEQSSEGQSIHTLRPGECLAEFGSAQGWMTLEGLRGLMQATWPLEDARPLGKMASKDFGAADHNKDGLLDENEFWLYYYGTLFRRCGGAEACPEIDPLEKPIQQLYRVFRVYCCLSGQRGEMTLRPWIAICHDSRVLGGSMQREHAEVLFSRAKSSRGASGISYMEFVQALLGVSQRQGVGVKEVLQAVLSLAVLHDEQVTGEAQRFMSLSLSGLTVKSNCQGGGGVRRFTEQELDRHVQPQARQASHRRRASASTTGSSRQDMTPGGVQTKGSGGDGVKAESMKRQLADLQSQLDTSTAERDEARALLQEQQLQGKYLVDRHTEMLQQADSDRRRIAQLELELRRTSGQGRTTVHGQRGVSQGRKIGSGGPGARHGQPIMAQIHCRPSLD